MKKTDFSFETHDGLTMRGTRYRSAENTQATQPIFCLHGLTRNERDFASLAEDLAQWQGARQPFDVYCLSFRGRGQSDRDTQYLNYQPTVYVRDVHAMAKALDVDSAIFIGTSLGGIVTMLTAHETPRLVKAALLNDIGPDLAPEGLARIGGYVGGGSDFANWQEAAEAMKAINDVAFPNEVDNAAFWMAFAERCCCEADGKVILDYDPKIAQGLAEAGPAPDLWAAFTSIKCPTLSILGEISDLFTAEIQADMKKRVPHLQTATISQIGHAPTLDEPSSRKAIKSFLADL